MVISLANDSCLQHPRQMNQPVFGFSRGDSVKTTFRKTHAPLHFPSTHTHRVLGASLHRSPSTRSPEADSRLMAGWPTGHVADAVLPAHGSTVCHLHLQA